MNKKNINTTIIITTKFTSMRMSQELAASVARQMTAKKDKVAEKLHTEYQKFVTDAYRKQIPRTIKSAYKKFPHYFKLEGSITLNGHGFDWENVNVHGKYVIEKDNGRAMLELTTQLAAEIREYKRRWEKERDASKALKQEIRTALINLRTFGLIQKHLPEAVKYLPKSHSREIMVNLDDLRTKIKAA